MIGTVRHTGHLLYPGSSFYIIGVFYVIDSTLGQIIADRLLIVKREHADPSFGTKQNHVYRCQMSKEEEESYDTSARFMLLRPDQDMNDVSVTPTKKYWYKDVRHSWDRLKAKRSAERRPGVCFEAQGVRNEGDGEELHTRVQLHRESPTNVRQLRGGHS